MAYTNNPYFLPPQEDQQIAGVAPMMQNIAGQQANQNAALAEAMQLAKSAGTPVTGNSQGGAMALAGALRKGKKADPNAADAAMGGLATYNPMTQSAISSKYDTDLYSQQSRMLAAQEKELL